MPRVKEESQRDYQCELPPSDTVGKQSHTLGINIIDKKDGKDISAD